MLLVIDIGNTNIVLGIFHGTTLEHSWRISTRRNRTVDEYASLCDHLFRMAGVRDGPGGGHHRLQCGSAAE